MSKQAEAKWDGVIHPQNYKFQSIFIRKSLMPSKRHESTEVDLRTWLHVPSVTHWSTSSDTHQVVEIKLRLLLGCERFCCSSGKPSLVCLSVRLSICLSHIAIVSALYFSIKIYNLLFFIQKDAKSLTYRVFDVIGWPVDTLSDEDASRISNTVREVREWRQTIAEHVIVISRYIKKILLNPKMKD